MTITATDRESRRPSTGNATRARGRRVLLLAVAALMCSAAALAMGILLFGDFGGTEGRVLATVLLLAAHGALTVPAAILWDQRRLPALTAACSGLAVVSASLALVSVWVESTGDTLGRALATALFFLIPTVVTTALATRPLHILFVPSVAVAALAASMATAALWTETEREGYLRLLGAIVVLDVLLVALQPLLLRLRREHVDRPLRITDTTGLTQDLTVRSASLADAVASAIRSAERDGRRVRSLEVLDPECPTPGA